MTQPAAVDKDFIDLVGREIRGHTSVTPEQKQWLHSDEALYRRRYALVALKKDVEVQLATQKARWCHKQVELQAEGDDGTKWLQYRSKEQDWRARAIKFLMAIEDEIAANKERRQQLDLESGEYLKDLIAYHRDNIDDVDASSADRELWSVLD